MGQHSGQKSERQQVIEQQYQWQKVEEENVAAEDHSMRRYLIEKIMAEEEGFEPPVPVKVQQFSRLPV